MPGGHPAEHQEIGDAADGVGAAAESEKEDPVTGLVVVDQELVAVDDIRRDATPRYRGQGLLGPAYQTRHPGCRRLGSQAWIVECNLILWIDGGFRTHPGGTIHLVNVAHALFGTDTAVLAGSVGKNYDVFGQGFLRGRIICCKLAKDQSSGYLGDPQFAFGTTIPAQR